MALFGCTCRINGHFVFHMIWHGTALQTNTEYRLATSRTAWRSLFNATNQPVESATTYCWYRQALSDMRSQRVYKEKNKRSRITRTNFPREL